MSAKIKTAKVELTAWELCAIEFALERYQQIDKISKDKLLDKIRRAKVK